jgi:hypothetical protein
MHLAQLNLGTMVDAIDSPVMASFIERLAEVNAAADRAPGFVWRLKDEDGPGAIGQVIADDDMLLVNLSVWTDLESLRDFVYREVGHREALASRRQWFEPAQRPMTVCWYVTEGHRPTLEEAQMMLQRLRDNGPTADLFPFTGRG